MVLIDLDRSNLGNGRVMGLPQDVLNGDPTGILFDWITSAFFFSYVSVIYILLTSDHVAAWYFGGKDSSVLTFFILSTDSLPNSCYRPLKAGHSSHLDGLRCDGMGTLLDPHGAYFSSQMLVWVSKLIWTFSTKISLATAPLGFFIHTIKSASTPRRLPRSILEAW